MKGKRDFPLFNNLIDFAHSFWEKSFEKGDWALDATCGNGHDTLFLAERFEGVIGLDIQPQALSQTKTLLETKQLDHKVTLFLQSHETFPPLAHEVPLRLVVYNLGYLPGSDKQVTTQVSTTLLSLRKALSLLLPGGVISLGCYPGHLEGEREEKALLAFVKDLSPQIWSVTRHKWENRHRSPSLLLIQKNY